MAELPREPSAASAITVTTSTDTPTPHSIRVVPSDVDATANEEASPSASISHTRPPSNEPSPRHARGCFGRLCCCSRLCASLRRSVREELDSLELDGSTVIIILCVIVLCCVGPFLVMLALGRPKLPFSRGILGALLFLPTGGVALFSLVFFCTLKCLVHMNNTAVILPSGQEMHLISLLRRARRSDHNEEQVVRGLKSLPTSVWTVGMRSYGQPSNDTGEAVPPTGTVSADTSCDTSSDKEPASCQVTSSKSASSDDVETCTMCLDPFAQGDQLRILPCGHAFHLACIDRWLIEVQVGQRRSCPVCKQDPLALQERINQQSRLASAQSEQEQIAEDTHTQYGQSPSSSGRPSSSGSSSIV